ncbi:MAG TPA: hypothetical protein VNY31_06150 [Solirubrobacteraceae bacterium]|nr:hypothetical protein [Solirubrobacteraceae bacterium]
MAVPHVIPVTNPQQLDQIVLSYVGQGYQPAMRTETSALLIKKKELSIVWVLVGLFLCFIPLVIELVRYYKDEDLVVEVRLVPAGEGDAPPLTQSAPPSDAQGSEPHLSADGKQWWDGTRWHRVTT